MLASVAVYSTGCALFLLPKSPVRVLDFDRAFMSDFADFVDFGEVASVLPSSSYFDL